MGRGFLAKGEDDGSEGNVRDNLNFMESVRSEVQRQIRESSGIVHFLLSEHREELERLAHSLLERESLDEQQLHHLANVPHDSATSLSESEANGETLVASDRLL